MRPMIFEKNTCLDCGADMEKIGTSVILRCSPCEVLNRTTVTERRYEGRMKVKKQGTLKYKDINTPMAVLVEDVSFHGAMIRYFGDIDLFYKRQTLRDSIFTLDIEKLELHTFVKFVWTTPINDEESKAGLRFIWHS